jgi:protein disulfide-isomerase
MSIAMSIARLTVVAAACVAIGFAGCERTSTPSSASAPAPSLTTSAAPATAAAPATTASKVQVPASAPAAGSAAAKLTPGVWLTNYEEAVRQSKASGLPILADFTGSDWCGWCIKLKAEVFSTPEFKAWAAQNVVLLELDYPRAKQDAELKAQNAQLLKKYKVEGFPTILFLTADGRELGQMGYQAGGPTAWTADAYKIIKPH